MRNPQNGNRHFSIGQGSAYQVFSHIWVFETFMGKYELRKGTMSKLQGLGIRINIWFYCISIFEVLSCLVIMNFLNNCDEKWLSWRTSTWSFPSQKLGARTGFGRWQVKPVLVALTSNIGSSTWECGWESSAWRPKGLGPWDHLGDLGGIPDS